jgi:hypothetical protein
MAALGASSGILSLCSGSRVLQFDYFILFSGAVFCGDLGGAVLCQCTLGVLAVLGLTGLSGHAAALGAPQCSLRHSV